MIDNEIPVDVDALIGRCARRPTGQCHGEHRGFLLVHVAVPRGQRTTSWAYVRDVDDLQPHEWEAVVSRLSSEQCGEWSLYNRTVS